MTLFHKILVFIRRWRYPGSQRYWEQRYARGGDSGSGSTGLLAEYKAGIVNEFVEKKRVQSVLELGCGDGQQLLLAQYPSYLGLDIALSAIARCQALFISDKNKQFALYDPLHFRPDLSMAEMALSMEVIFHLTEDALYRRYMHHLFAAASRWVVVFAANSDDTTGGVFPHFKPRRFLPDVPPGWILRQQLPNPHAGISVSAFFIFEKTGE